MVYVHEKVVHHRDVSTCLREAYNHAFILNGRNLSEEVRRNCPKCRRYRAKRVEVEMAPMHESRLTIAPTFYTVQIDLFGPYSAVCEHNHRATVKVWGVIFKNPSSGAIAVHAMQKYSTDTFLQA